MAKPKTIAEYIEAAPKSARENLRVMLDCLREAAPGAQEGIKWGVPALSYKRILFTFAAHKEHVAIYPTPAAVRAFATRLGAYKTSKSAIRFRLDEPLPLSLIREVAAVRVHDSVENDARWM